MGSSSTFEPADTILEEDLYDGWLVVPPIPGFLVREAFTPGCPSRKRTTSTGPPEHSSTEPARMLTADVEKDTGQLTTTPRENAINISRGPRQRRGHTKSRLGCITCKKRKIKCQETWPSCANCNKRGITCRYPTVFKDAQRDQVVSEVLSPRQVVHLSDTPTLFTANDMRLFHHYLTSAYPCIPHDYDDVWTRVIPTFSHQNTYLMHAILALAGSHLALQVEYPQVQLALTHRQKAIIGLEEAFTRWPPPAEEAHIMLATSYLLSFQSGFIEDGFVDNILSLRGCALLSQLVCDDGLEGPFFAVQQSMHSAAMDSTFRNLPHLDQELAREALQSIAKFSRLLATPAAHAIEKALIAQCVGMIRPLLEGDPLAASETATTPGLTDASTEVTMLSTVDTPCTAPDDELHYMNPLFPADLPLAFDDIDWDTVTAPPSANRDPLQCFNSLMSTLLIFATWPYDALVHILSPTTQLGNVVLAHFFAVRFLISPLLAPKNAMKDPAKAMIAWSAKNIAAVEDDEDEKWTEYVVWPKKILRCMQASTDKNKSLKIGDIRDTLINDPGAFKEGRAGRVRVDHY